MTARKMKRFVADFKRDNHLYQVDYATLFTLIERMGFTVVYYNHVLNDPNVATLIEEFHLEMQCKYVNGFTYVSDEYRVVFVNEELGEYERMLVLAHELGHIACNHFSTSSIVGHDVREEYDANEFLHYLILPDSGPHRFVRRHRVLTAVISVLLVVALAVGGYACYEIMDDDSPNGEFYVTATGEKYHIKSCPTIQNSKCYRMSEADKQSGRYDPCKVCNPK